MNNANSTLRMPALFIGHGSPMAAFEDNKYTRSWAQLGTQLPRPRAILCMSAHWYTQGTGITAMSQPRTIHDFYGFPDELYQYHYRAAGTPQLAQQVADLLPPINVRQDQQWGFDHGCWTVLKHMYPQADIPVLQLSIDGTQTAAWHYAQGQKLSDLRDAGVLILGSGNVVHNLRRLQRNADAAPYPWAEDFNQKVSTAIKQRDHAALIAYESLGEGASWSVPTPEHYLPLLYTLGASHVDEAVSVFLDEVTIGSISMLSVLCGNAGAVRHV